MSYANLCQWIRRNRLAEAWPRDVLRMVEAALEEMDENHPRYVALVDLEEVLSTGEMPVNLLLELSLDTEDEEIAPLEARYRGYAAEYNEGEWRTNFYDRLEKELAAPDPGGLADFADELEEKLTNVWRGTLEDYGKVRDVTAEVVVAHRLMRDGYKEWMKALELLETDATPREILSVAEGAVRLLVAVEHLDHDVKVQASLLEG